MMYKIMCDGLEVANYEREKEPSLWSAHTILKAFADFHKISPRGLRLVKAKG